MELGTHDKMYSLGVSDIFLPRYLTFDCCLTIYGLCTFTLDPFLLKSFSGPRKAMCESSPSSTFVHVVCLVLASTEMFLLNFVLVLCMTVFICNPPGCRYNSGEAMR